MWKTASENFFDFILHYFTLITFLSCESLCVCVRAREVFVIYSAGEDVALFVLF